jgi:hypothetical protein
MTSAAKGYEVRMEQPVYEAVSSPFHEGIDRAHTSKLKVKPNELTYQSDMDAEVTFDPRDVAMEPGTAVLAIINGKAGIFRIQIDDRTGRRIASERQRSWPITSLEPVGRVIEVRWRP